MNTGKALTYLLSGDVSGDFFMEELMPPPPPRPPVSRGYGLLAVRSTLTGTRPQPQPRLAVNQEGALGVRSEGQGLRVRGVAPDGDAPGRRLRGHGLRWRCGGVPRPHTARGHHPKHLPC